MHIVAGVWSSRDRLLPVLAELHGSLAAKAGRFADVIKIGRKQRGIRMPMTMGQAFGAFRSPGQARDRADPGVGYAGTRRRRSNSGLNTVMGFDAASCGEVAALASPTRSFPEIPTSSRVWAHTTHSVETSGRSTSSPCRCSRSPMTSVSSESQAPVVASTSSCCRTTGCPRPSCQASATRRSRRLWFRSASRSWVGIRRLCSRVAPGTSSSTSPSPCSFTTCYARSGCSRMRRVRSPASWSTGWMSTVPSSRQT